MRELLVMPLLSHIKRFCLGLSMIRATIPARPAVINKIWSVLTTHG
jgi:ABC-type polysaccharide/polyol phosphate export permease